MSPAPSLLSRLPLLLGLGTLAYLTYTILDPFLVSVAWASILVFVTWPLYQLLLRRVGGRRNLAASIMTLFMALLLVGPLAWILVILQSELHDIYVQLSALLSQPELPVPEWLRSHAPWASHELEQLWLRAHANPASLKDPLQALLNLSMSHIGSIAGGITRNVAKILFTLFTLFFFYRDGLILLSHIRRALLQMLHHHGERYLRAAGDMARAVVIGIVLTALAQALLAGVGYAVANTPNPVFLALITFLAALIPFGTPFAWGGVTLWLLASGDMVSAIGLALWGALVVSSIDNVIRPLVISNATEISFLLIMFGVLGGLAAFGMIGLFLGPIVLAVVASIWQEWLNQPVEDDGLSQP